LRWCCGCCVDVSQPAKLLEVNGFGVVLGLQSSWRWALALLGCGGRAGVPLSARKWVCHPTAHCPVAAAKVGCVEQGWKGRLNRRVWRAGVAGGPARRGAGVEGTMKEKVKCNSYGEVTQLESAEKGKETAIPYDRQINLRRRPQCRCRYEYFVQCRIDDDGIRGWRQVRGPIGHASPLRIEATDFDQASCKAPIIQ
jgi:hypothetical protein